MNNYTVIHMLPSDENFFLFEEVVQHIYPESLWPAKKTEGINRQFLHGCYVVLKDKVPAGRCCLYNNPLLSYEGKRTVCIGNYECTDDDTAIALLMDTILAETDKLDAERIVGPMNGSTWDTYRLGVYEGAPNFFLEPWYPAYYHSQFSKAGFGKIARYVSAIDRSAYQVDERIRRTQKSFDERGIRFRSIDLDHYEQELEKLYTFCMSSFRNNFLFSPIDKEDFVEKYRKVKSFIRPEYVLIAENREKEMVGFVFCLENYFDKKEKGLIIKTIARDPSIRYGGMGNLFGSRIKEKAQQNGYTYIIHAFMLETNVSKNLSGHFSGEALREYFLYAKNKPLCKKDGKRSPLALLEHWR